MSLVPSQSELLWDLGLHTELVGITKFCIHPEFMFRKVTRVGGTKTADLEKIRALSPDLIIGNKEENTREQIETLRGEFPVWMSDITTPTDALDMITALGLLCHREDEATRLHTAVAGLLARVKGTLQGQSVAYLIWNRPYMVAAANTFVHNLLEHLGLVNVFASLDRYPEVSAEQLAEAKPDLCFLSSEPFPFQTTHVNALQRLLPGCGVRLVDGEVFSWYGSRLLHLESYLQREMADLRR